ncbi:hypothetical protein Tco_0794284 [Tanacetum coccineum]
MVDVNVNAPAEQAPAMAPPTRTDDQILPRSRWVPVGKSNCYLDVEKSQSNPIYKIAVDILKHTNFFRAFTASSTIPSIYIQQFWDTVRYVKNTRSYSCQLDEQWFDLTKDTLRDALQITPVDNNNPFSSPPTPDALINFVNELGYPKVVRTLSAVVTNDMFQPWRALTTIINLCLTGKTSAFERPRAPVLQILWGVVNRAHIDYAERMWEEFTQSIHSFVEDKKNLALHTQGKKKANPLVIPSVRFTKLIIHHLQSKHKFHPRPDSPLHLPYEEYVLGYLKFSAKGTKREVFGMPIPNELITADIRGGQYYKEYLEKVAKHQRYLDGEEGSDPDSPVPKPAKATKPEATKKSKPLAPKAAPITKPAATKASKSQQPKPAPAKPQEKKRKLVMERFEAPSLTKRSKAVKEVYDAHRGPLPPVVIREPDSGKFQPLLDVQGKGKEKVSDEQVALDLLTLQTPKKKNPAEQYIFQRRSFAPTEPSGQDESSSLYAELGLTDSETESDEEVPGIYAGYQDEGQVGPNPGIQDKGQSRSNPSDAAVSQPQSSHAVHAGLNREHIDFGFHVEKSQEDEPEKTNTESEVQLMVTVPIHQDTSSVPLMATLVIDVTAIITRQLSPGGKIDKHGSIIVSNWRILTFPVRSSHRIWETKSYEAHEDHKNLYEALEKSMDHDHSDQLLTDLAEARRKKKRRHESPKTPPGSPPHQPPPPPPPAAAPSSSKIATFAEYTAWTTTNTRLKPFVSSIPKYLHMDDDTAPNEQPPSEEDRPATPEPAWFIPSSDLLVPMNNWASALASTYAPPPENSLLAQTGPAFEIIKVFHPNVIDLQYQMEECHKLLTDQVDDAIIRPVLSISKMKAACYPDVSLEQMVPDQMWIEKECKYDIAAIAARTHKRILSVVRIKVFSLYGYDYMKMIVLRRADLNEYIIAEKDFKYLYPSDFEDLYLLNLQGHLNHLSPKDKKILSTAVNLWIRNLVIRQRVEDFQLGIESYQTQLNLTKPRWDAIGFEFKHDFTVIDFPRAVTFKDKYGVQMIMRFNEIHKFSDGTLQQIDEALDYWVKEFKVNRMNPGLNTRFWTRKDVDRSNEFMFSI